MMELTLEGWIIGYLLNEGPSTADQIAKAHGNSDVTTEVVNETLWSRYGEVYQIDDVWYVS